MSSKAATIDADRNARGRRNAEVDAVFRSYPKKLKARLESLRKLILAMARGTDGVGRLEETLKWGQPSYLTSASKSGSTIRIDALKSDPGKYALYVHCQTDLVATFRQMYPRELTYGGNRSILFDVNDEIDEPALRHCIALALTYRLRKSRTRRSTGAIHNSRRQTP